MTSAARQNADDRCVDRQMAVAWIGRERRKTEKEKE